MEHLILEVVRELQRAVVCMQNQFRFPFWPFAPANFHTVSSLVAIVGFGFTAWMLIDCLKRRPGDFKNPITNEGKYDKLVWAGAMVLSLCFWFIGTIVYYFVVKKDKED